MITVNPSKFTELLGSYGMLALVGAYFLVSFRLTAAERMPFQLLNFTGGVALVIFAISKKAMQLAILNTFWALIGATAIIRLFL